MVSDARLSNLLRHIAHVRDGCLLLAERLAARGEAGLGRALIANGLAHDRSKFFGVEWEFLNCHREPCPALAEAVRLHVTTNRHHPEAWPGGVGSMDRLHLAEMVVDWHSRSAEQGTCLRQWVAEVARPRFGFGPRCRVGRDIDELIGLLLDKL